MKRTVVSFIILLLTTNCFCQHTKHSATSLVSPKLIIGIVVDQMRYDFLYRYWDKYGSHGFKRLVKAGFNCRQTQYNYMPTVTAAGHSAIYTGAPPSVNGIYANEWYDRHAGRKIYCVEDSSVETVGSSSKAGKMSPGNLQSTTITDQLKLATVNRSKVIGIALKDRGAILPAGHAANAAYWYDSENGRWITSTYYMQALPEWVKTYNAEVMPVKIVPKDWNTLMPIENYSASDTDDNPYERKFPGEAAPVFPHTFNDSISKATYNELIRITPFGNEMTTDFAITALQNEQMGKGNYTDFLTISYSSTDYVGHAFGPYSVETEDTYLRLDKEIARLLTFIDEYIGKKNVLLFLTADHGVTDVPGFSAKMKIPGKAIDVKDINNLLSTVIKERFGNGNYLLCPLLNNQLYVNSDWLVKHNTSLDALTQTMNTAIERYHKSWKLINLHHLTETDVPENYLSHIKNGFSASRSGDLMLLLTPGSIVGDSTGTSHGSYYRSDTHVPLLWYGWKIKPGQTFESTVITDIAPTLAAMLNILEPNGCVGRVIPGMIQSVIK